MLEKYGFDHKDSFEVEVFVYEDDGTDCNCGSKTNDSAFRKLNFLKQQKTIINDLLVDIPETDDTIDIYDSGVIDTDYVEYYLDFTTDAGISKTDLCDGLRNIKAKNVLIDADLDYECPDIRDVRISPTGPRAGTSMTGNREVNIYETTVTPEDIEDCEE